MYTQLPFEQSETAKKLATFKLPRYSELTSFPIVMRQLINILDKYLSIFLIPGEEKMLTQPMINSYVYKKIIKPPRNKEYNRRHIIHLLSMGILKQVLQISDVAKLIKLQTDQYPIRIAYNFFCDELENALKVTFSTRSFSEIDNQQPLIKTPLSESVRSATLAFANMIYVKQSLYYNEQAEI